MRILLVIVALFALSGCAGMEFVAVDYHNGHSYGPHVYPTGHIHYNLGYYGDSYYNGYRVYGTHGHRYYYAPPHYAHHRHFARPVVVQHVHVHTSYCEHNVRPHHYTPPAVVRTPPRPHHVAPPRHTPPRHTPPPRVRNNHTPAPQQAPPQVRVERQEQREDRRGQRRRQDQPKRDRH